MNKVYVVGIGPGDYYDMSLRAIKTLEKCSVIVGYTVYIDLVKDYFKESIFLTTPMKKERDRCEIAFKEAEKGSLVAMICSGDSQVYGMASLMYEMGTAYPDIEIEVISGITAALSGGAILGAPLNHDFAVISLSDLLTPWHKIEKRIELAAIGDFAICFYNPSSKKRSGYLKKACNVMLKYISEETICGVVKNIGRSGEQKEIMTLKELKEYKADMFSTIFIGNSQTKIINENMVTPRGYKI